MRRLCLHGLWRMSAQTVIDSLEFIRTGQTLRGSLPVSGLSRLQDSLFDALGEVGFVVTGGYDVRRRPILTLDIHGALRLRCQRCLAPLDHTLRLVNTLLLADRAEVASGAPDDGDIEWIEASAELDVAGLIEDEIILSLPYAPRHAEGCCGQALERRRKEAEASPFARLAALKKELN